MNNNMAGMNMAGGPVGGGMPMMNNGKPAGGIRQQPLDQRSQLNTYIYDYFLRNQMHDCARALYQTDPKIQVIKDSPGRNGADDEIKDELDQKRPDDLPESDVPRECLESCFLYEWWCLFWDMFNAQRGKGDGTAVMQYVNHTQAQSRQAQMAQQSLVRGLRNSGGNPGMPGGTPYDMQRMMGMGGMNQGDLRQKALQNTRNSTPAQQQQMLLAQQQQQQKQQQMQRDPSGGEQQRVGSPGSVENAPSPSKRQRLDGAGFNPQGQMPNGNGRGQPMPQQVGTSGPNIAIQAAHMQLNNGIESALTAQQFQNLPPGSQARALSGYQQGLAQQQAGQMPNKGMPNPGGPPNQGSPMMPQGQDNNAIAGYYNAGEMGQNGNMRPGQPGGPAAAGGGNHALQDYQMQLMLLEQQNKKRLMMARQEQDNMGGGQNREGGGGPGMLPNGQPFQQTTSPQGARSVNSPNPTDQMKRGTPHMNPAGMPSPIPEGQGQSRGSPSGMNFNMPVGQMDPNMSQQFYMKNGMDPNMAGGMANGMRPPSSHPGAGSFNPQGMTQTQLQMARAQQGGNWQNGQNGQMMPGGPNQGGPQQPMGQGTPQQRPMAPPAAPGPAANGRTQPSSPQQNPAPPTPSQLNKAAPKKKTDGKDAKSKRAAAKKGGAPATGATPSADPAQEPATPTPATPITPVHTKTFAGQNGVAQPVANGQPAAPMNAGVGSLQPDLQNNFLADPTYDFNNMDFNNNVNGTQDVLQDFDFDSFLHQDGDTNDNFNFESGLTFMDGSEIGAD